MSREIISSQAPIRTIRAVCVDSQTLRNVATNWGKKDQVKLVFETEELKGNGYPRTATRTLNISYYEKGTLRKALEFWLSRPLTASEMLKGFPFERLVGKAAEIDVQEARSEGGTAFLRIVSIRPAGSKPLAPTGSYRRWEDPAASAKPSLPALASAGRVEPMTDYDQDAELEAQFGHHVANSEALDASEPPTLPDNANTVVVTAGN
jgi:hypothetical protein